MNFEEQIQQLLQEFPVIETKRLSLRLIGPDEANAVFHLRAEDQQAQYIGKQRVLSIEEVADSKLESKEGPSLSWVAKLKGEENGGIIGTCGFFNIDYSNRKAELGGEMATAHWGKYYAVEGTLALLSFGFNKLQFETIECAVSPDNESAIYLLEKLGFHPAKEIKNYPTGGKLMDLIVYSRSKGA